MLSPDQRPGMQGPNIHPEGVFVMPQQIVGNQIEHAQPLAGGTIFQQPHETQPNHPPQEELAALLSHVGEPDFWNFLEAQLRIPPVQESSSVEPPGQTQPFPFQQPK